MAKVDAVKAKVLVSINGRFLETTHLVDCTISDIEAFK
ncbi:hypothetical protein RvY_11985 [Ramazzottius varieornatus]|uniref:Uncharacterized protein n=1 Tax=Ramazzottius varieornatus TaxID=947166 RepID=A0A1D1VHY8_RAMVA|nr:hypothetical protein RvY_11985 [Ramazzottius varieornatus]